MLMTQWSPSFRRERNFAGDGRVTYEEYLGGSKHQRPASPISLIESYLEWVSYCVEYYMKEKDPVVTREWYSVRKTSAERLKGLLLGGE